MRGFVAFVIASVLFSASLIVAKPVNSPNPVCIVGGGPSGLSAASRLESKGYKTVIFEKEPKVGGVRATSSICHCKI